QIVGPDAIYVAGVGQHQMWASQFINYEKPGHWLNSGGLGTMGYSVPAAMGAKVGAPDKVVWAIDGDGCFQMTNQELATCAINNIRHSCGCTGSMQTSSCTHLPRNALRLARIPRRVPRAAGSTSTDGSAEAGGRGVTERTTNPGSTRTPHSSRRCPERGSTS